MLINECVYLCTFQISLQALERRKEVLSEVEEKAIQLAGDADNYAILAEKLANKYKHKLR